MLVAISKQADVNAAMFAAFFRVQHFRCSSVGALTWDVHIEPWAPKVSRSIGSCYDMRAELLQLQASSA